MLSGCIMCSTLACVMLSCFWLSEALSSPMRPWRRWCRKFGQSFANCLRRRRPRPGDKWYLDEVFIRIQGVQHYLWRAVDQNGVVLDILVQGRRAATAATRFFRRLLAGLQYVPRVIVTDKLTGFSPSPGPSSPPLLHGSISSRR